MLTSCLSFSLVSLSLSDSLCEPHSHVTQATAIQCTSVAAERPSALLEDMISMSFPPFSLEFSRKEKKPLMPLKGSNYHDCRKLSFSRSFSRESEKKQELDEWKRRQ